MQITKSFLDQISAPPTKYNGISNQAFYRDSTLTGFGVRVTSGGVKSFIVEKRIQGKVRRVTLGQYGDLSVEQARKEAMRFLDENATSKPPVAEIKYQRDRKVTLLEAFEDYIQLRKDLKPATIHDYRRSINGAFVHWQSKPLTEITKDMVQLRHSAMGKRSKARANNAMRVLRAVFNHAITMYEDAQGNPVIENNPVDRLNHMHAWYRVESRRTWIEPGELPNWIAATRQLNNETTRNYLHLLLFTGLRRSEASKLQWNDVDFNARTLTVRETKNHRMHVLPLSDFLYELLKQQKAIKESPYVFPSNSKRGYLIEPRSAVKRVSELSGITFTLHDLRRSFIKIAESLDIPDYALKSLLNHKGPNEITVNNIASGIDRVREPMQQITDFIIKNSTKNTNNN
ncbi:MAG: tyrosine-type recombinase/integrase [Gammaproteobacteria bacterium]|jgi:integrase|nr:tyrosine-type recombinase/integrase [Gammaproteobacteria bacterium]